MQRMEGELAATLRAQLPRIGHVQLADNPGRHEPGTGEINYRFLLPLLDEIGYTGWIGCEYRPAATTIAGLGWLAAVCRLSSTGTQVTQGRRCHEDRIHRARHHGLPMAAHLIEGGHELYVNDIAAVPETLASKGARSLPSARAVAEAAEIVIIMVPDTPDVDAVLFGQDGVAEGLSAGQDRGRYELDLADRDQGVRPAHQCARLRLSRRAGLGRRGRRQGRHASRSWSAAPTDVFERVKPLFELMGKNITLVGGNGDGQTCKVANQIIVALTIEAVAEALLFASKAGADPAKVREALMGGFASSRILEVHGERMIKRSFDPGFRIQLHQKDLNLALSSARQLGLSLPNTATAQELFNACAATAAPAGIIRPCCAPWNCWPATRWPEFRERTRDDETRDLGATKLYGVIADPIEHVRATALFNAYFEQHSLDAVFVPFHVHPEGAAAALGGFRRMLNLHGVIVTIPHKTAFVDLVDEVLPTARLAGATNVIRPEPDGRWIGGNLDGMGFVNGLTDRIFPPMGRSFLVVGCGGAGSAIAATLIQSGITRLAIAELQRERAERLAARLSAATPDVPVNVFGANPDPAGYDVVVNATPLGMREDDPLPFDPARLSSGDCGRRGGAGAAGDATAARGCGARLSHPARRQHAGLPVHRDGALLPYRSMKRRLRRTARVTGLLQGDHAR